MLEEQDQDQNAKMEVLLVAILVVIVMSLHRCLGMNHCCGFVVNTNNSIGYYETETVLT